MNNELKNKLQHQLDEHFANFINIEVGNVEYRVMPSDSDIPQITEAKYSQENDTLIVMFETETKEVTIKTLDKNVDIYIGDKSGIVGVKISNLKELTKVKVGELEYKIPASTKNFSTTLRTRNLEKRKFNFFKDMISPPTRISGVRMKE